MKKLLSIILLLSSVYVNAQMLQGRVFRAGTDSTAVAHASLYFDGMYKSVVADENGFFKIYFSGSTKIPLIVSAVGYNSESITDYSPLTFIKVYLRPKVYTLSTITITNDGLSREEKEKMFKKEFIGISTNASGCEIKNMDDISLTYNKKSKTLKAFSDQPILIYNKKLNYKITYYLDEFTKQNDEMIYSGNYFFEEDTIITGAEAKKVARQRKFTYLGSRMHFIRSLWNNTIEENEFRIISADGTRLDFNALIQQSDSAKMICIKDRIRVIYKNDYSKSSHLFGKKSFTYIDKNGFYDPSGFSISGYLSKQRVGDLLPFEYHPYK